MRILILFLTLLSLGLANAQTGSVLSFGEYLGYVKSFHPVVKQADLLIGQSEAGLMRARGAFDPKLELDYDRKEFKNTEYYDKLNATFKVPTWYGVELKANFENNTGEYLNPEYTVPADGIYSVGVSVSLAKGLVMNERMAVLKQAKLFKERAIAERQLLVNDILYEASIAYFTWLKAFNDKQVYESFLSNASLRFDGIKKSFEEGEIPAIDTLEAGITVKNRKLELEKARIAYLKSMLDLSNFLWLQEEIPVELQADVIPDISTEARIDDILQISPLAIDTLALEDHPKMRSLDLKYQSLQVEKRWKTNDLLPRVDLEYNFLSDSFGDFNAIPGSNYKSGVRVSFPLFLRKERGDLKLTKLKMQDTELELKATELTLKNKIDALGKEIVSYQTQTELTRDMVADYEAMLVAEERKFQLGESLLFLINSRESKLIESKLKAIEVENQLFVAKTRLFQMLGNMVL